MYLIELYLVFIIATASTSTVFFFIPILRKAIKDQVDTTITNSPVLSTIAYYLVSLVFAPVLFLILISNTYTTKYLNTLGEAVRKQ